MSTLKSRIDSYQESYNYKILAKLPLVISINGRSFLKTTSLLDKPFCEKFAECMISTMMKLCQEVEGCFFGYYFNDEIVLILKNDQTIDTNPWFDNKIQKICSATASIATNHFNDCAKSLELTLNGDAIFLSEVFAAPTISEALNCLIYKQQQNFYLSAQYACFYELLKFHNKETIKEMLSGLSLDEKIDLLNQECDIDFNKYNSVFRRGAACYKVPKLTDQGSKNKWFVDRDLQIFSMAQSFLTNIGKVGHYLFSK